ncbi:MAG: Gfo/Idh/MocA family protein, partial [Planctomycetota bacterium]
TLAEGVALTRAVEKSKKIYMLAENYCYFAYNQEMRRLYREGEIGQVRFAECEYNHPGEPHWQNSLSNGEEHWRNWIPSTYYCTHALGPIMYITDARPKQVNAHSIALGNDVPEHPTAVRGDPGSSILVRMDNGSTVNVFGLKLAGHSVWYRLHGSRGLMENLRTQGEDHKLRLVHEEWDRKPGDVGEKIYTPEFPISAEMARQAGHGGGDFFTNYHFGEAIRKNRRPYLDVYRGVEMTVVGIQAWRSCLDEGRPYDIPDFRKKSDQKKYENDHWSPFPEDSDKAPNQPPPSITGMNQPSAKRLKAARKDWKAKRDAAKKG